MYHQKVQSKRCSGSGWKAGHISTAKSTRRWSSASTNLIVPELSAGKV